MAAVEPRGDDGGDEELGAVAGDGLATAFAEAIAKEESLRVGAGVGHGKQTGLVVLQLEVLVGELLAVDGLATGAVATGEVTTLEHEVGDDAVEGRALVAESLLAGAESAEVGGGLGDNVIEEVEDDAAVLLCMRESLVSEALDAVKMAGSVERQLEQPKMGEQQSFKSFGVEVG